MKVKYIGKGKMNSKGVTFTEGTEQEVTKTIGNYLLKTFPKRFVDLTPAPKSEPKSEEKKPYQSNSKKTFKKDS